MKCSQFLGKILNKYKNLEYFILARKGKALVRGCSEAEFRNEVRTIAEACFSGKEMYR